MEKILILLDERNRYLTKFLLLTEEEELKFRVGNFNGLDRFYEQRESLLEMVRDTERMVDIHLKASMNRAISDSLRRSVAISLQLRDELINRILVKDLDILGLIEHAKSKIIRELQTVGVGKKAIGAYHSGTKVSKTLDEEI